MAPSKINLAGEDADAAQSFHLGVVVHRVRVAHRLRALADVLAGVADRLPVGGNESFLSELACTRARHTYVTMRTSFLQVAMSTATRWNVAKDVLLIKVRLSVRRAVRLSGRDARCAMLWSRFTNRDPLPCQQSRVAEEAG